MDIFQRTLAQVIKPATVLVFALVLTTLFFYVDQNLANYFELLNLGIKFPVIKILTYSGVVQIYGVIFLAAALFFRYIKPKQLIEQRFWFLWGSLICSNTIACVVKILLGRARPVLWFKEHLWGFYGLHLNSNFWSCPSGHTTTLVSIGLALGVIFPRYFFWFISGALCIASTRILLVQHYLTDVLSAAYLSVITIGLFIKLLSKKSWLPLVVNNKLPQDFNTQ